MEQLSLNITPRLAYSSEGFLVHEGVSECVSMVRNILTTPHFSLLYIQGPSRSGKTHLSIFLSDLIGAAGRFPRVLDAEDIGTRGGDLMPSDPGEVLIVDDLDRFLHTQGEQASGPFVHLVEAYRKALCPIVFLGTESLTSLPSDEHVMSRLRAGIYRTINSPPEEVLPELIERMAKQRGIRLKGKKIDFLIKRLNRSIPEIESYLERVNYLSSVFGKAIKMPLLSDAL